MNAPTHVGPYQVVRTLGRGGMGVVYEVRHPSRPDLPLALKLLLSEAPPPQLLARFHREAEVLNKVVHPNVVQVHDFAQDAQGKPYMVFQFVAGRNLRELCRDAKRADDASCSERTHMTGNISKNLTGSPLIRKSRA